MRGTDKKTARKQHCDHLQHDVKTFKTRRLYHSVAQHKIGIVGNQARSVDFGAVDELYFFRALYLYRAGSLLADKTTDRKDKKIYLTN